MKILNSYLVGYIQFEIEENNGHHHFYRRLIDNKEWDKLWDSGWEEVTYDYDVDRLEEEYQKHKLLNGTDTIYKP
jgi:hypothetical protein